MNVRTDIKAISTLAVIILIVVSAIIGGIISYAFTIAYYAKKPQGTTLTITGVYINKDNVNQFTISVLNPSYSPTDATISRIAISLEGETQLYDVIETEPSIENGIAVAVGESKNITCIKIRKDNANVTLGELIGSFGFAGKTVIIHVFSSDSVAANVETKLPFVQLNLNVNFNPKISVKRFNVTVTNDPQSAVNVTVKDLEIWGVIDVKVDPNVREQPIIIQKGKSQDFMFNVNWSGVSATVPLIVYTEEGYKFKREIELKGFGAYIESVDFSKEDTNHFHITILNSEASASYVNVTKIRCKLDNETYLEQEFNLVGITPNTTETLMFNWNWKEYRDRNVTIVAYFLQDFETAPYTVKTPSPIIVEVEDRVFDLRNTGQFNITIKNHASSIEAINITQIMIKENGQILNGTTQVDPPLPSELIYPGNNATFKCTFDWATFLKNYGRNLTLTIKVVANKTLKVYANDFSFTLPVAELNITTVDHVEIGKTRYLNVTVKNLDYSLWNLTLSKIVIIVQGLTAPLEYAFPKNQMLINVGDKVVLLCPFDWQKYQNRNITVTALTDEHVEATYTYHIP